MGLTVRKDEDAGEYSNEKYYWEIYNRDNTAAVLARGDKRYRTRLRAHLDGYNTAAYLTRRTHILYNIFICNASDEKRYIQTPESENWWWWEFFTADEHQKRIVYQSHLNYPDVLEATINMHMVFAECERIFKQTPEFLVPCDWISPDKTKEEVEQETRDDYETLNRLFD